MHHGVTITDSALVAAAKLSDRYISNRFLPDKAIDLIDEAAAELKMQIESEPYELARIKREIVTLQVEKEALKMLRMQSDNVARIVTAMIFLGEKFELINVSFAEYKFAKFDEADLQNYLSGDLWQGKAGAMTIENFNKKYILSQNGETSTAMGLNVKILKAFL